jgi:hypothetical protein
MGGQLRAFLAQNKPAVLGAAGVGVVGLALQNTRTAAAAGPASTGGTAGTMPAAGVALPAGGVQGAYPDTSATDVYNALMPQLEALQAGQAPASTVAAATPPPISSTLFAPNLTGQYVYYKNTGTYGEIESDGSVYGISGPELGWDDWNKIFPVATPIGKDTLTAYSDRATNLSSAVPKK